MERCVYCVVGSLNFMLCCNDNMLTQRDGERFKDKVQERFLHQYELDGQRSSKSFYGSLRFRKRDKIAEAQEVGCVCGLSCVEPCTVAFNNFLSAEFFRMNCQLTLTRYLYKQCVCTVYATLKTNTSLLVTQCNFFELNGRIMFLLYFSGSLGGPGMVGIHVQVPCL